MQHNWPDFSDREGESSQKSERNYEGSGGDLKRTILFVIHNGIDTCKVFIAKVSETEEEGGGGEGGEQEQEEQQQKKKMKKK